MPARSAIQASSGSQASRRLALHSSASSHTPTPLQMHSSASATLKDTSANECDSSVQKAHPDATGASRGNSTGESVSRLDSHQQRRAVACNLLCNLRVTSQSKDDLEIDSSIDAIAGSSEEQRETGASNMQMPVMKAERRQGSNLECGCAGGDVEDVQNASLNPLANVRQLIVDAPEHLLNT